MTDNTHDHFDELLQDAARTYNRPPEEQDMPLGEMWDAIEAQAFPAARHAPRYAQWVRVAAALIVGVGIGRVSLSIGRHQPVPIGAASVFAQTKGGSSGTAETLASPLDPATSRYLGQAAALLIELPAETNVGRPDQPFIKRANEWPNDRPLRLELEQQELEQRWQERKLDLDLTTPRARPFDLELPVPATSAVAPLPPLPPVPAASSYVETNETRVPEALDGAFLNRRPPAPWAAHDPADSLYRVARQALNRGDYRRAAQLFNDLTQRFPNSAYAYVSTYYEAFSRYRIGTTEELRAADRALQTLSGRYAAASNGSRDDTD